MAQWYLRDEDGAYLRLTTDGVPSVWAEGILSLIQLRVHEQGVEPVNDRKSIKHHMIKKANRQHSRIAGPDSRVHKPSAQSLRKHARDGRKWNKDYGAMLAAGRIPDKLADLADGSIRNLGPDLSDSEQTRTNDTGKSSRQLLAMQRPVDEAGTGQGKQSAKRRGVPADDGHQTTAGSCEDAGENVETQTKAGQSQGSPKRRRVQESAPQSSQRVMQDCPVTESHTDAAEVAGRRPVLAKDPTGEKGQKEKQLIAANLCAADKGQDAASPSTIEHEQQPSIVVTAEMARAAVAKRKSVAISGKELAQLGLSSSSSNEDPDAAKLFWARLF
ncbi:g8285 [Coccomyxa viridis]|uniref:G8285 protein n=1 Tax=Coccomyxa viridis TaxID=1274662 RepID=A0ABP1G2H0_9CHLO